VPPSQSGRLESRWIESTSISPAGSKVEPGHTLETMPDEPEQPKQRVFPGLLRILLAFAVVAVLFWITGCMERMFYQPTVGPTPAPMHPPGVEVVRFQSRDDTELVGWFIPAQTAPPDGGKSPTILHVHGNAGNIESHVWFTEFLPAHGFNVFLFDYRGYGESQGTASKRGPLIEDTHAALDGMLARPDVDPKRIGMYGQSLGGAIGINVMADRPEIRAAVLESAFSSWREEAANVVGGEPPGIIGRTLAWVMIPDTHRPTDAIARVNRPVLLLHGDADSLIPVSHSRRLKAASNGHATLIEYPGGDHNTLRDSHPEMEQAVLEFFRKHLTNRVD